MTDGRDAVPPDVAIRVEGLSKTYLLGQRRAYYKTLRESLTRIAKAPLRLRRAAPATDDLLWALRDVSFDVKDGDVVGIIGRNGAGKSTLLKVLSRITEPTEGRALIRGRIGSLLEVGTGFHPELTGAENIFLNGAILGMHRSEILSRFDEMVAFAEIAKFIDTPVKHYSSGMYLRLAFAVAAHLEPEILLVDEVLAVGDALFQKKCLGKMEDVARAGRTVLFVSHNMAAVRSLCTTGIVLNEGRVVEAGEIGACVESYFKTIGVLTSGQSSTEDAPAVSSGFGRVVVDGGGGPMVQQSEPSEMSTVLNVDRDVSGFTLFCIVEDVQNRMVFHLKEDSPGLGLSAVPQGMYAVRVRLPALWLNTGLHSVHFKVLYWGEHAGARVVSDKFPLDIAGLHSSVDAVLHPAANWTVGRVPAP